MGSVKLLLMFALVVCAIVLGGARLITWSVYEFQTRDRPTMDEILASPEVQRAIKKHV